MNNTVNKQRSLIKQCFRVITLLFLILTNFFIEMVWVPLNALIKLIKHVFTLVCDGIIKQYFIIVFLYRTSKIYLGCVPGEGKFEFFGEIPEQGSGLYVNRIRYRLHKSVNTK